MQDLEENCSLSYRLHIIQLFRGPRSGMIFYRKGVRKPGCAGKPNVMYNLKKPINEAVFPGLQGGPHNHAIAGVAVALHQAKSPRFVEYQKKVS